MDLKRVFVVVEEWVTYNKSVEICAQQNAILLPVKTEEDLKSVCEKFYDKLDEEYWRVGLLFNNTTEGKWSDGTNYNSKSDIEVPHADCSLGCEVLTECGRRNFFRHDKVWDLELPFLCYRNSLQTSIKSIVATTTHSPIISSTGFPTTNKQSPTKSLSTTTIRSPTTGFPTTNKQSPTKSLSTTTIRSPSTVFPTTNTRSSTTGFQTTNIRSSTTGFPTTNIRFPTTGFPTRNIQPLTPMIGFSSAGFTVAIVAAFIVGLLFGLLYHVIKRRQRIRSRRHESDELVVEYNGGHQINTQLIVVDENAASRQDEADPTTVNQEDLETTGAATDHVYSEVKNPIIPSSNEDDKDEQKQDAVDENNDPTYITPNKVNQQDLENMQGKLRHVYSEIEGNPNEVRTPADLSQQRQQEEEMKVEEQHQNTDVASTSDMQAVEYATMKRLQSCSEVKSTVALEPNDTNEENKSRQTVEKNNEPDYITPNEVNKEVLESFGAKIRHVYSEIEGKPNKDRTSVDFSQKQQRRNLDGKIEEQHQSNIYNEIENTISPNTSSNDVIVTTDMQAADGYVTMKGLQSRVTSSGVTSQRKEEAVVENKGSHRQ